MPRTRDWDGEFFQEDPWDEVLQAREDLTENQRRDLILSRERIEHLLSTGACWKSDEEKFRKMLGKDV